MMRCNADRANIVFTLSSGRRTGMEELVTMHLTLLRLLFWALQGWQERARQYVACIREQITSNNALSKCGGSRMWLLCSTVDAVTHCMPSYITLHIIHVVCQRTCCGTFAVCSTLCSRCTYTVANAYVLCGDSGPDGGTVPVLLLQVRALWHRRGRLIYT
jgi:hypothetical protein